MRRTVLSMLARPSRSGLLVGLVLRDVRNSLTRCCGSRLRTACNLVCMCGR